MSNNHFLKDNMALVAGISLPMVLVIIFWIATVIPKLTVADPGYDMIYTADNYDYNAQLSGSVRLDVKDGKLRAQFHSNAGQQYRNTPRIFYFDVSSGSTHEISLDIPGDLQDGQLLNVPEASPYTLSKKSIAPDGYSFDGSYSSHSGFLFFGSGYRYRGTIRKEGRAVKIPTHGNQYQGNLRFLGWVVKGADS
jgi:hypothetical protein